jgi:hypothetical protein
MTDRKELLPPAHAGGGHDGDSKAFTPDELEGIRSRRRHLREAQALGGAFPSKARFEQVAPVGASEPQAQVVVRVQGEQGDLRVFAADASASGVGRVVIGESEEADGASGEGQTCADVRDEGAGRTLTNALLKENVGKAALFAPRASRFRLGRLERRPR